MFFFIFFNITFFIIGKFIIWTSYVTSSLPLSKIVVTGKRFYTTNNDIRNSVLKIGSIGTFMKQDVRCIQNQIKSFSWIQQVSVRKQWPDKIKVHIIEYAPVGRWNYIYMITKDAIIFTLPEDRMIHSDFFPCFFGPLGSEHDVLRSYYVFNEVLKFSSFRIKSVSMDYRYSWNIVLNDGVKLILGREDNIFRLQRFIKVYPEFLKKYINKKTELIDYIDLRYRSGFSVKKIPLVQYIK